MARKKKQKHSLAFLLLVAWWYYPSIGFCKFIFKFLFEALFSKEAKRRNARLEKHSRDFFNKR